MRVVSHLERGERSFLKCVLARIAGADAQGSAHLDNENLTVTDPAGPSRIFDRLYCSVLVGVVDDDLNFDFGHEVDFVLCPAINLLVAALATVALSLAGSHAVYSDAGECFSDLVEAVGLQNRDDHLHRMLLPVRVRTYNGWLVAAGVKKSRRQRALGQVVSSFTMSADVEAVDLFLVADSETGGRRNDCGDYIGPDR